MKKLIASLLRNWIEPAALPVSAMSEHGEFLDYAERESRRKLDDLRTTFNAHFERALKVLTLLTGGAGAVAAYIVNQGARLDAHALVALLILALGWSVTAAYLAIWGMRSRLMSSGPLLTEMAETYIARAGSPLQAQSAVVTAHALRVVRLAELNREHLQTHAYEQAVGQQTRDLRRAVVLAALAPAFALALWAGMP